MHDKYRSDKAEGIVRPIAHCTLDEEEIKILKNAVKKIQARQQKQFRKSLSQASKITSRWPKWKQDALGTVR